MRRLAIIALLLAGAVAGVVATAGADDSHTYEIQMYNAFGIVNGSQVRVAGVNAGTVTGLDVNAQKRAVLTVSLSGPLSVLGKDTRCSSEPQSLIAEYFIDCDPKGPPLPDGGTIPADHVTQTVQTDLVQNTLRLPFAQRLQLLINEFGTALAGNPKDLNKAIMNGAPALRQLHQVTRILASENTTIRDLNANSDRIISQLAARRADVVRFIQTAGRTSEISAERQADLSKNFELLDNFLARLRPTLAKLGSVAGQQTPLLRNLRAAGPGLNTLAVNLPAFNQSSEKSLSSLGQAARPGETALRQGRDELQALAASGQHAFTAVDALDKFMLDIASPKREVEIDARAAKTCNDKTAPCYSTGRSGPTGYTGMEGLLNYVYYQAGALNQFDLFGHLLHFSLFDVGVGPCGSYNAGENPSDDNPPPGNDSIGVPKAGGGTTTSLDNADPCVSWIGPTQPGINANPGLTQISPYDPSVCPQGSTDTTLCNPAGSKTTSQTSRSRTAPQGSGTTTTPATTPTGPAGGGGQTTVPDLPNPLGGGGNHLPGGLGGLLGLGHHHRGHHGLPGLGGGGGGGLLGGGRNASGPSTHAAQDLLNFLFSN